ncbi:hypothetical protein O181_042887 [Austropuccinia psidii MF-1]|uniref:Uncharacterized protein n=1 Tax=Austropuccinia psidii MF-1 TaxID=1389203 RepID=A0A9Q3HG98_9BASI|nr:hypothetical protein [Austropuccinia psidii MF-1]
MAYKTSFQSSPCKAPDILQKWWNSILPEGKLRKDLVEIHPTDSRFKLIPDKVTNPSKSRNTTTLAVPMVEQNEDRKIKKEAEENRLSGEDQIKYLVRYGIPAHENWWLAGQTSLTQISFSEALVLKEGQKALIFL